MATISDVLQTQQRTNLARDEAAFYQQQFTKQQKDELEQAGLIGGAIQQWLQQNQPQQGGQPPPQAPPQIPMPQPGATPPNAMAPGAPSVPMQQGPPMGAVGGMSRMPEGMPPPPPPPAMQQQPSAQPMRVNFQGSPQQIAQMTQTALADQGWKQPLSSMMPPQGGAQPQPPQGSGEIGEPPQTPTEAIMERTPPNKLPPPTYIFEQAMKKGADPAKAYQSAANYSRLYGEQQKEQLEELRARAQAASEAKNYELARYERLRQEYLLKQEPKGPAPTAFEREAADAYGKDTPEYKAAIAARVKRESAPTGGEGGPKETGIEKIYPRNPDGSINVNADPIGTEGYVNGKLVVRDTDGNVTTRAALQGGTQKQMTGGRTSQGQAARLGQVKAGIHNSLNRLDEIEKKFPNQNTSAFFGQSGQNPLTRAVYGAGRGALLSSEQKQADAMWSSFIDEAIPVFTGGLRGSDAFRRFLIEQAPGPGDDAAARKEKRRLIRANIEGTSRTFFNTFASNPKMWAEGTKPEEVQTVKQEVESGSGGGGEWKVEKVK